MLTELDINEAIHELGWRGTVHFQSKEHRDQVWAAIQPEHKVSCKRSGMPNQSIDPRYTFEGRHLPDLGMANDRIFCNLYTITALFPGFRA